MADAIINKPSRNERKSVPNPAHADTHRRGRQAGRSAAPPPVPRPPTTTAAAESKQLPPPGVASARGGSDPFCRPVGFCSPDPGARSRVATRGSGVSLEAAAAAVAAGAGGDGALRDAGALRLHQRHTQLPQQGAGAPPRRQGARQHPHAVQKREGHTLAPLPLR